MTDIYALYHNYLQARLAKTPQDTLLRELIVRHWIETAAARAS